MTLVALYAETYHGVPRDDQPWHEFVSLLERIPAFEARHVLAVAHGTQLGQPVEQAQASMRQLELGKLKRIGSFEKGPAHGV